MTWFQEKAVPVDLAPFPRVEFPGARVICREAKLEPNIADLEEAAYQRGQADQNLANTEALAELAERHQAEIAATAERVRTSMLEAEAAKVASLVAGMPDQVVAGVLEVVAPVLRKLLLTAVQDRAISELGQLVRKVVTDGPEIAATVTAPAELIEIVKSLLPHDVRVVKYVAGESNDVEIKIGDVELSAALEGWRQAISGCEL